MEEMKICTKCGKEKPMTEEFFHKNPDYACGYGNRCKVCVNEKWTDDEFKKARNEKNRLKTLERKRLAAERKKKLEESK